MLAHQLQALLVLSKSFELVILLLSIHTEIFVLAQLRTQQPAVMRQHF